MLHQRGRTKLHCTKTTKSLKEKINICENILHRLFLIIFISLIYFQKKVLNVIHRLFFMTLKKKLSSNPAQGRIYMQVRVCTCTPELSKFTWITF